MLKKNSALAIGVLVVMVVLGATAYLSSGFVQPAQADAPKAAAAQTPAKIEGSKSLLAAPDALKIDVESAMKDRVLGNENAPVTIIEYASMTCPHCAHFAGKILPEVKKRLLDTGKAKLIFRDFPLDNFALKAAMMDRCIAPEKFYNLVDVVFSNQERWTHAKDPLEALAQLGALAGMDADYFKACTTNTELETAILNGVQKAQTKYQLKSTPTFIFNEGAETFSGAQDADQFETIVNRLTKGK